MTVTTRIIIFESGIRINLHLPLLLSVDLTNMELFPSIKETHVKLAMVKCYQSGGRKEL